MTRLLVFVVLSFLSCFKLSALEVSFDVCAYSDVQSSKSYIDTYIRVFGSTVSFEDVEGGRQAAVHITITVEQGSTIVNFDKYILNSPKVAAPQDFLDLKRFALAPGVYAVHLIAVDAHDDTNVLELKQFVTVQDLGAAAALSDVLLLAKAIPSPDDNASNLVKHSVLMEPLTYGFLNEERSILQFFLEAYQVSVPGYISYGIYEGYVEEGATKVMAKYRKIEPSSVLPLILQLPVDKVRSGSYHLKVELFNDNKEILASSKVDFIRRNPDYDKAYWTAFNEEADNSFVDSIPTKDLRYNLIALVPVVQEPYQTTLQIVLSLENERAQRHFLFDYWKSQSPKYPHIAFRKYMQVADMVHDMYDNNVGFGFQTDRGHMFLKYGKPSNVIAVDNEPDAFPYEIWYYNELNVVRQSQVRFIFYNPSLAHNDYQLLHSTCIGERNNPAWEVELYKRAPESQIGASIEATQVTEGWNRRAKAYFNDF